MALQFGDYNHSDVFWISNENGYSSVDMDRSRLSTASCALVDGFNLHGLSQLNQIANSKGRILDLILANDIALPNCTVSEAIEPLTSIDIHHPAIEVALSHTVPVSYEAVHDNTSFNFRKADFAAMNQALLAIDWSYLNSFQNLDDAVDFFTNAVSSIIAEHVPLAGAAQKPPWSTNRLRMLKRHRSSALRKYCSSRSLHLKLQFNRASRAYRNHNRFLYARYIIRMQRNLRTNPKQFWSFVKSKRNEEGLPSSMYLGNLSADSTAEKCELFASQFKVSFNNFAAQPAQVEEAVRDTPQDVLDFDNFYIDENEVARAISKLKFSLSVGPDGIPSAMLKRCTSALCQPLMKLFSLSFQQGVFPSNWKSSFLFPVFKKGDKRDVSNYRGITSLCACSKVFEIIVNDVLFARSKHYISVDQHGFYPKRSVATNLAEFTSLCIQAVDSGKQVDAVYMDLKAAFDRVDHNILLKKLEKIGVTSASVDWFRSYLTNRSLCVKIGSSQSEMFVNQSGVPQGSNLGPLLFSLFINDVSLILPPGVRLFYADDAKVYVIVNSFEDCLELQNILNSFENWCTRNCMTLSIEKCQVITFSRKFKPIVYPYSLSGQPLARVQRIRDLGVSLDQELTFRFHYDDIISRSNRQLGFIMKIASGFRDVFCLRSLYCALVRSILEFGAIVWCPYHDSWITRIESVQRKFVRYAFRNLPWRHPQHLTPYQDRCQLLGIETLKNRRQVAQAMFVVKILRNDIDSPSLLARMNIYAPERLLRRRNFLQFEPRNTLYGQHDPVRFMSATFDEVFHLFDFNVPVSTLQRRFTDHFRNT